MGFIRTTGWWTPVLDIHTPVALVNCLLGLRDTTTWKYLHLWNFQAPPFSAHSSGKKTHHVTFLDFRKCLKMNLNSCSCSFTHSLQVPWVAPDYEMSRQSIYKATLVSKQNKNPFTSIGASVGVYWHLLDEGNTEHPHLGGRIFPWRPDGEIDGIKIRSAGE